MKKIFDTIAVVEIDYEFVQIFCARRVAKRERWNVLKVYPGKTEIERETVCNM